MDVILAADATSVAESLRGHVNGSNDVALSLAFTLGRPDCAQGFRRQHRPCPRPEILGRDFPAGNLLEVRVHVLGVDFLPFAIVVQVLEELFSTQLLTALNNPRDALVGDRNGVLDPALALELESHLGSHHCDVTSA